MTLLSYLLLQLSYENIWSWIIAAIRSTHPLFLFSGKIGLHGMFSCEAVYVLWWSSLMCANTSAGGRWTHGLTRCSLHLNWLGWFFWSPKFHQAKYHNLTWMVYEPNLGAVISRLPQRTSFDVLVFSISSPFPLVLHFSPSKRCYAIDSAIRDYSVKWFYLSP